MIKSIQKALMILKIVSNAPHEQISLKEICEKTQIEKSTCHHILDTLCFEGFLQKSTVKGFYTLGPEPYLITRYGKYKQNLITVCHPVLKALNRKTKKAIALAIAANNQKFIIDKIDSDDNLYNHNAQIFTDDIYRTATGRILMSHMSTDEVKQIYNKYGPPSPNDWEGIRSFSDLCVALKSIKNRQYVKTSSKMDDGTYHIGYGRKITKDGKCVGAIGIAFSDAHNKNASLSDDELVLLFQATAEINKRLG